MSSQSSSVAKRVRAVSSPGGPARQFRVQYQPRHGSGWRIYGSYRQRPEAEASLSQLLSQGHAARLIECRLCPSAN